MMGASDADTIVGQCRPEALSRNPVQVTAPRACPVRVKRIVMRGVHDLPASGLWSYLIAQHQRRVIVPAQAYGLKTTNLGSSGL
jgi:hypothetical protein